MTPFKTIRSEVLSTDNLRRLRTSPAMKRLALAASDYQAAVQNPEWAKENGGVDAFRHDLFVFIEQWFGEQREQAANVTNRSAPKR